MKYLKLFNAIADFESFKNSDDFVLPNVSLIEENNTLFYNPDIEEIIEYHFEIPVEKQGLYETGEVNGDFSKSYNELVSFAKKYGDENEGFWEVQDDIVIEKTNIVVNGMKVISLDYYSSGNQIECVLSDNKTVFQLKADNAYYEKELFGI